MLRKIANRIIEELNNAEQSVDEFSCSMEDIKSLVLIFEKAFEEMKSFVHTYAFKDESEEILFFKETKPKLFCKLIYYQKIYNIKMRNPTGSNIVKKNYFLKELDRIKDFFDNNIEFFQYFRSGDTYLDRHYFLRGKPDILLSTDSFCFEFDQRFSSSFDFKVAKILANDMLSIYLNKELHILEKHPEEESIFLNFPKIKHTWTGTKTELVELIYAIYTKGSIDHGNIDIKELVDYFCHVFNTDAGDFYRIYLNIRNRKDSRTLYLDSLRDNLNKKMDDDDSK